MRLVKRYNLKVDRDGNAYTADGVKLNTYINEKNELEYPYIAPSGKWSRVSKKILVARAYLPNPFESNLLAYRDGDRNNIHIDNLEWVIGKKRIGMKYERKSRANRDEEGI